MKLHFKGHPIHVILIHFPAALFPTSMIFDLVGLFHKEPGLLMASFYCQITGFFFGVLAVISGAADLYGLYQRGESATMKVALIHAYINGGVLMIYFVLVFLRIKNHLTDPFVPMGFLVTEGLAVLLLMVGNFYGGEAYRKVVSKFFS